MPEPDRFDQDVQQGQAIGHLHGDIYNGTGGKRPPPRPTHNFTTPEAQPAQGFIGREKELADLHTALVGEAGKAVAITQAIVGEGGIGKSAVAREYAIRFGPKDLGRGGEQAGHYGGAWWVDASDATITASAERLARVLRSDLPERLTPEQVEQIIREELAKPIGGRGHLLILDNLESDEVLKRFKLPPHSRVLATTKRRDLPFGLAKAFELKVMSPADAINLLKRGREAELGTTHDTVLGEVAKRLGHHALALGMANAWLLRKSKPSPSELLARLNKGDAELATLLTDAKLLKQLGDYSKNVVEALSLHWKDLQGTEAMKILRCAAFCAPDQIPADVLAEAAGVKDPEPALEEIEALGIGTLERLVPKDPRGYEGLALSLHRLMQVVLRHQTPPDERDAALRAVVDKLFWPFEDALNHECWPRMDDYHTHAETALSHADATDGWADAAALGNQHAVYLEVRARLREAEGRHEKVLAMKRRLFDGDHLSVASSLNNLASVRRSLGRAAEAEPMYVAALDMTRRLFPGDHPEVAQSLNNLACVRETLGRAAEAEPIHAEALDMRRRLFPGDHPDVASSLNNLASVRRSLGRAAEAEPMYVEALDMTRRLFPGDHPDVASSLNNLASVRRSLGRAAEAEPMYVEALDMRRRLFPGDHPDVAQSLNNLAVVRDTLGRATEAEPMYVEALDMRRRLFPGDHPDVASSLNNLASLRYKLGRAAEAEPMVAEAAAVAERVFGADHPSTKLYRRNLELCRKELGK